MAMLKCIVTGALVAGLGLAAWPALAQTYSAYFCTFRINGFGSEEFKLLFATDKTGKTFTYDVAPGSDQPVRIPEKVRQAGEGMSIFLFAISEPNVDTGRVYLTFQARVPKAGGPSRLAVQARRFRDVPSGTGNCELKQNVSLP